LGVQEKGLIDMEFSLAITAFNEITPQRDYGKKLQRAIRPAQGCNLVSEIVIVDDASEDFAGLVRLLEHEPKVCLYRNKENLGVFGNKIEAVVRSHCDWVITCDSDNEMDRNYLEAVSEIAQDLDCWYCPSFAAPKFDYRKLASCTSYDLTSIAQIVDDRIFCCFFNTGNQTVNRASFAQVFERYRGQRADLKMPNWLLLDEEARKEERWRLVFNANDSFIFNLYWLWAGKKIQIVPDLQYAHHFATGDEGNYRRSPQEKVDLGMKLLQELKRSIPNILDPVSLPQLGEKYGTDKVGHEYLPHYQQRFDSLRDRPISILEIGVFEGASLRMWADYFPLAQVYGIDCNKRRTIEDHQRIRCYGGKQQSPGFLKKVLSTTGDLDIVVDDGSHRGADQVVSYEVLWPHVRPGGWYCIEDCSTLFNEHWTKPEDKTILQKVESQWRDILSSTSDIAEVTVIGCGTQWPEQGRNNGLIFLQKARLRVEHSD
jgi:glycosyltransferase involved in cell wall biosynthesis